MIRSALGEPGPATVWFRLERALVEGEENSPLVQAVSAADLTIHFWRRPRGSWILVDALTGSRLPATYPARVHVEAR